MYPKPCAGICPGAGLLFPPSARARSASRPASLSRPFSAAFGPFCPRSACPARLLSPPIPASVCPFVSRQPPARFPLFVKNCREKSLDMAYVNPFCIKSGLVNLLKLCGKVCGSCGNRVGAHIIRPPPRHAEAALYILRCIQSAEKIMASRAPGRAVPASGQPLSRARISFFSFFWLGSSRFRGTRCSYSPAISARASRER